MVFDTERVLIRKLCTSDIENFYDMQSNPNVMRHIKKYMNRSESENELKRFISYYENKEIFYKIWAVIRKDNEDFMGICGVYENEKSEFEIAYRLRELYWGKGYGAEIAINLINYCFEKTNLNELSAYVSAQNNSSIYILEKEMEFIEEFFCKKTNSFERVYKLKKESWLSDKCNDFDK
ncbi:GNAT family N-acetyltransferase [Aquimarina sp. RZ0]|uniref:GNAT family N-acetyltransferase n=1 Tax=Aquimarina sp. RZ0 TaxID=2607730 RepID=UPI0011F3C6A7|nr:GNAT family N-acetyltransferase [Aquimarina sp. RZ0]KAA1245263.1 GNAT family N-acetyltransferase [Aquimarina sp. RZ0]